jgi:hypothetical protein
MHAVDRDRIDVLEACFDLGIFSKEDVNKRSTVSGVCRFHCCLLDVYVFVYFQ